VVERSVRSTTPIVPHRDEIADISFGEFFLPNMTTRSALLKRALRTCGIVGSWLAILGRPGLGAERVSFQYGAFERSLSVRSIEVYVREGYVDGELAPYIQLAPPDSIEALRDVLLTRADIDPVAIAQFLYTPQGEALLQRLGEAIQTGSGESGFKGLRSATILAAADEEGLTLLNVLRYFPTYTLHVDFNQTIRMAQELQTLVNSSEMTVSFVRDLAAAEAEAVPLPDGVSIDLSQPGAYPWDEISTTLRDPDRDPPWGHRFPVDLYLPQTQQRAPIVVISHGLGSDRSSFRYLAEHLASHGFAVLVPEHPGSNAKHMEALLQGHVREIAKPEEFIDRPLDVTFLLDTLEVLAATDAQLQNRLDFDRVGVIGQSFGGYTALTLAGAELDFAHLAQICDRDGQENRSWNASLLLQCRALDLETENSEDPRSRFLERRFRDDRVRGVMALNPVGSALFGEMGYSNVDVPVAILASGADTIAPAVSEQIHPFTWLTVPERYLVLVSRGTHFSTISASAEETVALPSALVGPDPRIAQQYVKALSLAFFQTYIADRLEFQPYLSAAYAQRLSRDSLPLSLVQELDGNWLDGATIERDVEVSFELRKISKSDECDSSLN